MKPDLIGFQQSRRGHELTLRAAVENPLLALKSATAINAEILGISDEIGTIEVGKIADLAVWTTDPIENPKTFGDPNPVALVVRYFTDADLIDTFYRGLADNTVGKIIDTLLRADLIVIDLCRPCNYAERLAA